METRLTSNKSTVIPLSYKSKTPFLALERHVCVCGGVNMYGCKDEVCVGACVCACIYVHVCVWVNMYECEDEVHMCMGGA